MTFRKADRTHDEKSDIWFTPKQIIQALGVFDLDPCTHKDRPFDTALEHYTPDVIDGLTAPWWDRVWLNQPYSEAGKWADRMARHGNGTMLVFARTETVWFQEFVFKWASAILFIEGRLSFLDITGKPRLDSKGKPMSAGAPSCLVAYDTCDRTPVNAISLQIAVDDKKIAGEIVVPCRSFLAGPRVRRLP